jgi:hypothetical protein
MPLQAAKFWKQEESTMFFHSAWILLSWLISAFTTLAFSLFLISFKFRLDPFNKISKETPPFTFIQQEMHRNKRQYSRLKVDGIVVHISDGRGYCEGFLNDISRFGLCLKFKSDELERKPEKLGVLLIAHGKYFPVRVKPKWELYNGSETCIGSEIDDTHWHWEKFKKNIGGVE